jgi:hypothetical protein
MNKTHTASSLALLLCGLVAFSCAPQKSGEQEVSAGNWGHLTSLTKVNPTKMYLSHVRRDEPYKICLANYMVEKYPGIESELTAAVNIWAHYIGRRLPVEIIKTNLPQAYPEDSEVRLMEQYYTRCPRGVHLVVGESYFSDSAVGKTQTNYTFVRRNERQNVVDFQRLLFLKKPIQAGETASNSEHPVIWKSLSQVLGKEMSADEILEMMKERDKKIYLTGKNELLTFKTIVHEFGHIWGLCDQYALDGNATNCDGNFATLNAEGHIVLDDEAMMARSSWMAKLYLTDDDIEGIRKLAERAEFTHNWPTTAEYRRIQVRPLAPAAPVAFVKINSAKLKFSDLAVNLSLVTSVPVDVKVRLFSRQYNDWLDYSNFSLNQGVSYQDWTLNIGGARQYQPEKAEITVAPKDSTKGQPLVLEAPITDESRPLSSTTPRPSSRPEVISIRPSDASEEPEIQPGPEPEVSENL